jgi:hypothetical protein
MVEIKKKYLDHCSNWELGIEKRKELGLLVVGLRKK